MFGFIFHGGAFQNQRLGHNVNIEVMCVCVLCYCLENLWIIFLISLYLFACFHFESMAKSSSCQTHTWQNETILNVMIISCHLFLYGFDVLIYGHDGQSAIPPKPNHSTKFRSTRQKHHTFCLVSTCQKKAQKNVRKTMGFHRITASVLPFSFTVCDSCRASRWNNKKLHRISKDLSEKFCIINFETLHGPAVRRTCATSPKKKNEHTN